MSAALPFGTQVPPFAFHVSYVLFLGGRAHREQPKNSTALWLLAPFIGATSALAAIGAGFLLAGTRNDWLYSEENIPEHRLENFLSLQGINLETSRAWAIKETLRGLWSYRSKGWARKFFIKRYAWAIRSQLGPTKKLAGMVKRHIENILTYCDHPITNAVAEGVNSKIMSIKRQSSGFRNRGNFKTVVYFYCGKLKLDPLEHA